MFLVFRLILHHEEAKYRMACHENEESNDDIEDDALGFLELLFITSRDENEPPCIDDEDDTDDREESVEKVDDIADNTDTSREILIFDGTTTRPEELRFSATRTSIDSRYECPRNADQEKSNESIDDDVFAFFRFLLVSTPTDDDEECIDHHAQKSEARKQLHEPHNGWENIDPHMPSEHRSDAGGRIAYDQDIPYREGNLHNEYSQWDIDDIGSPFLHMLFVRGREEESDDPNDEENDGYSDEEILDIEGDLDNCIHDTSATRLARREEEFSNILHKPF